MQQTKSFVMNRALASIVLSLIMLTGVTAGSVAFAESDEIELKGILSVTGDNTFELETRDGIETISINDDTIIDNGLSLRELDGLVVDVDAIIIDEVLVATEIEFEGDDDIIAEYDVKDYDIREKLDRYCEMTDDEKRELISKYDKAEDHVAKMDAYCELDENERDAYIDEYKDKYSNKGHGNLRDHFATYCDMTPEKRAEKMQMHSDLPEELREKLAKYCEMSENEQDELRDSLSDRMGEFKDYMKDKMYTDKDMRHSLEKYCEMTDSDKTEYIAEHDKDADKAAKMDRYCTLDENGKTDFIHEHLDEYKAYIMDKYSDKKHDFDRMSDMAKDRMSDDAKDKLHDKAMKFSDESKRLKAMIMEKRDISDERHDEIRMKYEEKHGDNGDKKRVELKIKFKDHMAKIEIKITDERKSVIHDRVAEMKAFKVELRESSELTDEEKQVLRAEFIERAKDLQLAWISPRTQMHAGIDAADIECREGFSHVMKASNGVAMCLKADTALKMIDRGIAVPAN